MPASTAREALIVEVIGDLTALVDRVEALAPTLDASRQAAAEAIEQLSGALEALEGRMAGVTETARTQVVRHVVQRTEEAARRAQEVQSRVIAEAAHEAFRGEVEQAMQRLAQAMQAARPAKPPVWEAWLTHVATAVTASIATWLVIVWSPLR